MMFLLNEKAVLFNKGNSYLTISKYEKSNDGGA